MIKLKKTLSIGFKILFLLSIVINLVLLPKFISSKYGQHKASKNSNKITHVLNRQSVYNLFPIKKTDVVFMGDSQTQRFDFAEFFNTTTIKNRGIDGDITAGVLNRVDKLKGCPIKIFFQIGINDFYTRHITVDSAIKNYNSIINTVKNSCPTTKIYIQGLFPSKIVNNDTLIKYNENLKKISSKNNLIYIDLYSSFLFNKTLNSIYDAGDGVHLSGKGYDNWKNILKKYL